MIIQHNDLLNCRISSLQTGRTLGSTLELIVDPRNLSIPALFVNERNSDNSTSVLHISDIRQNDYERIIVNSYEDIMDYREVPKLKEVVDFDFGLIDTEVATESGTKLGQVTNYAVSAKEGWRVKKIIVQQNFIKKVTEGELLIDASQIVSTSNDKIIVSNNYSNRANKTRLSRKTGIESAHNPAATAALKE